MPILARLEEPEDVGMATSEAAAEWDKPEAVGDTAAMRAMTRRRSTTLSCIRRLGEGTARRCGSSGTGPDLRKEPL